MVMFNPPHPGEVLKELYMTPLKIKQKDLAEGIGVTKKALSELTNGHTAMSTTMALKLSEAFNTTPEFWLNLQQKYDLHRVGLSFDAGQIQHFHNNEKEFHY